MKIPKSIQDRRRSVRLAEQLPFTIGHEGYEIESVTVNISSHGVLCVVDRDIPMMTQLKVALALPDSPRARKPLQLKGVVVRKEKHPVNNGQYLIAVFFSGIGEAEQKTLENFIQRRLQA